MDRHRGVFLGRGRGGDTADLREHNLAIVLRYLRDYGPSSRARIAEWSGLGLSTLTGMIAELKELELVSEDLAATQAHVGRPTHSVFLAGGRLVVAGLRLDVDGVQARTATVAGDHLGQYSDRLDLVRAQPELVAEALATAIDWVLESVDAPRTLVAIEIASGWPGEHDLVPDVAARLAAAGRADITLGAASVSSCSALAIVRSDTKGLFVDRRAVYIGGERSLVGGIIVDGEPLDLRGSRAADFARIPSALPGGGRETLADVVSLPSLLAAAGIRSRGDAEIYAHAHPRDARAALLAALGEGDPRAVDAVTHAAGVLSGAIDAIVAVLGADVVVLDGYLAALGAWLVPAMDARVQVVVAAPLASRAVDGAVFAARDAVLAQPSRLRA
ncbi:hypothetical protein [Agreia sp.]|uniref:hypothetical protein n=1 Tax=Agreia sp. TaxID=1872416 RepID=UPI0035BC5B58